jgi:hypothetical protein
MNLLDVVALTEDMSDVNLRRGQVGTIVEVLAPGVFEVEFADNAECAPRAAALTRIMPLL